MKIRKIMIVDDDPDVRTVTELSIRRIAEWEVVAAASGEEALAMAGRERPDAILLDTRMPGLDGPGTLERLQRDPATAAIPVIFMTAKVQPHDVDRYRQGGAWGVIAKPFDAIGLPEEIRRILASGSGSESDPDPAPDLGLRRLREDYRTRLERDLIGLEADLAEARRHPAAQRPILDAALALAHRLKGTSGSYGFSATSAALATIETRLEELLAAEAGSPFQGWSEIDRALSQARSQVAVERAAGR